MVVGRKREGFEGVERGGRALASVRGGVEAACEKDDSWSWVEIYVW